MSSKSKGINSKRRNQRIARNQQNKYLTVFLKFKKCFEADVRCKALNLKQKRRDI
jgi:hypothetical protein